MLTLCPCSPQADTSSLSGDNTLMSTLEEKETDGEQGPTASPAPQSSEGHFSGLDCVPPSSLVERPNPTPPQNVTVFQDSPFKEVIQIK